MELYGLNFYKIYSYLNRTSTYIPPGGSKILNNEEIDHFEIIEQGIAVLNFIFHTSYLPHMCEEFARIHHIYASVTCTCDQFRDFTGYDFFTNVMLICVKNTFVTCVTNTFIFVTGVTIWLSYFKICLPNIVSGTDILMYMYINLRMWFLLDLNWPIYPPLSYMPCPALLCPAQPSPAQPSPALRINKCTPFTLMLSLKYHMMITVIAIPSNTYEVSYLKKATILRGISSIWRIRIYATYKIDIERYRHTSHMCDKYVKILWSIRTYLSHAVINTCKFFTPVTNTKCEK